ncbi:hypothetical protein HanXRQr2_Chr01g0044341 [Helianthus annuus]|uniref:Uncharacterized protein n=1 Tax=Helianthus annuus TaxID=4232 RepID=A0A251VSP9_HELAN|nr:hypothetical protein HanXRQr2_Chr01g0044341 [Helianthus annuus]
MLCQCRAASFQKYMTDKYKKEEMTEKERIHNSEVVGQKLSNSRCHFMTVDS